jgi:MFS family permease
MSSRLRGTYALAVAVALLGLCPNLVLSTGLLPLTPLLARDLGTSTTWLQVASGLSNAAFATGVVFAAQLAQRHVQRRLFLGYAAAFVAGSVLVAVATSVAPFLLGRVLQGGATGLMLISALPPLVTRFGVGRLPVTVALVNLGLFGATTLGPLVGGLTAGADAWRALAWAVAGVGVLAWAATALGYPASEPPDPDLPVDGPALALATVGTLLTFLATSLLVTVSLASPSFWVPFVLGLGSIVALVVVERRRDPSLMPVRELSTQLPVTGTLVAMIAGAAFVTVVELVQLHLSSVAKLEPSAAGWLFWPMPLGLLVAAVALGAVFRTRYLPVLVNVGLLALAGGCALLLGLSATGGTGLVPYASALLGFGAGATVTPGLFLAGLGVRAHLLGRAFALVQLLRLTTSFAVGPVVVHLARGSSSLADGVHLGVWVSLALCLAGLVVSLAVPALSGARLVRPDLEAWLEDGDRGIASPAAGAQVRTRVPRSADA